jgi:peptidylprolyl isomerase
MDKKIILVIVIILIVIFSGLYFLLQPKKDINLEQLQNNQQTENNMQNNFQIQGMNVEILREGTGDSAKNGDTVKVNYVGTLQNGTKFDSSIDRGEPFSFKLGEKRVIQGWELGVLGMKVGEKRKLTIPPELAYGSSAIGGVIPANSTLIFEIDLLDFNPPGK